MVNSESDYYTRAESLPCPHSLAAKEWARLKCPPRMALSVFFSFFFSGVGAGWLKGIKRRMERGDVL